MDDYPGRARRAPAAAHPEGGAGGGEAPAERLGRGVHLCLRGSVPEAHGAGEERDGVAVRLEGVHAARELLLLVRVCVCDAERGGDGRGGGDQAGDEPAQARRVCGAGSM